MKANFGGVEIDLLTDIDYELDKYPDEMFGYDPTYDESEEEAADYMNDPYYMEEALDSIFDPDEDEYEDEDEDEYEDDEY
jgi:hypothetical protein